MTPRLAVIGTGGHGRTHLARAARLDGAGIVRLVAVADPHPPDPADLPAGTRRFPDGAALLAAGLADVVVICTPIHTHYALADAAMSSGADVLLEKPTTATLAEFRALVGRAEQLGRLVQVGFQSLGSSAIAAARERIAAGAIGDIVRWSATGAWVRDAAYWSRSAWAGRRILDGRVVADGVLTNPLAHATATALAIAGTTREEDVRRVGLEMWHANDIEADDTSVALLDLADGRRLTTAVTLAAERHTPPFVEAVGTRGALRFWYKEDVLERRSEAGEVVERWGARRTDLLENLLAARAGDAPLLAPAGETGAFMRLVDAVMAAPAPRAIPAAMRREVDDDLGRRRIVPGIEEDLARALRSGDTFSATGALFARGGAA
ncbi:Gfo/Idh/MocA family protein [Microbacterium excoecariae]|uniref:Gfo/Idh/MocA family protein n=1 Tax=Microbacterium excoecariae TaxID=2715210 RepID=UPI00140B3FCE|nr:Gfo/Idh/MocA family oxidoreductase [Microbacterium excoecariae]NHI17401.1 Gfo/Idh/MocA family oxidoreductase [Microbacterium excoecariae]